MFDVLMAVTAVFIKDVYYIDGSHSSLVTKMFDILMAVSAVKFQRCLIY
jgi:hypothetical protein